MSMEVRRIRFLEVLPSAIRSVRFSEDARRPRLAVARANGSLEVWNTEDGFTYYQDFWIPGRMDSAVESMLWFGDRLLTAGFSGHLDQWDLASLIPCHSVNCQGGPVWCIVCNPTSPQQMAVGCEDGMVRMFDVSDSGFSFRRVLHRQESRVLCLAWHENGDYIVMGGMDSAVRIIRVSSASCTQRITLNDYKQKSTLLWDVKFIDKSSIITANSLGRVEIWDFKHCTLLNTFNQHSADVLTLTSQNGHNGGSTVFASGVDSMIMKVSTVAKEVNETKDTHSRWIVTGKIRPHQHDVLSLHLSRTGMLASGGTEGELVITNTSHFSESAYVKYQPFPCMARNFKLAENGNLLLFQDISTIILWCISQAKYGETSTQDSPDIQLDIDSCVQLAAPFCLLELKAKPPHNILSSAISSDGSAIAVSNAYEIWIYHFDVLKRQLLLLTNLSHSAVTMWFKPNEHRLFFTTPLSGLQCAAFGKQGNVTINTILNDTCIKHFEVSADGLYLAIITKHWRIKLIDIVRGTIIAKLPKLQSMPIIITFNVNKPELIIFVGGNCREVFVHHITENSLRCLGEVRRGEKNKLYEGRLKFSHPLSVLPMTFEENLFSIYDNDSVMMFRLVSDSGVPSKNISVQLVKSASLVLFVGSFCHSHECTGCGEKQGLIIIERSQKDILQVLPPTLYRKQYGT